MNLLEMVQQVTRTKTQWSAGEVAKVIPGKAWLRHAQGDVHLYVRGYQPGCLVLYLNLHTSTWTEPWDLAQRYATWSEHAKIALQMKKGSAKRRQHNARAHTAI
jgi:hypothetical protein